MAAVTAAAMRDRVKNMVFAAMPTTRPYETPLATAGINASVTTIDVPTGTGTSWAVNDIGEFEEGEQFLVTAVSTDALTVIRGHAGTTAASHAQNDIISQNSRFTVEQIDQVIDDSVVDLGTELYKLHTITDTYSSSTRWFPMDAAGDENIFEVIAVYHKPTGSDHPVGIWGWTFKDRVDATGFTEDNGLFLSTGGGLGNADTFYIATKKRYLVITDIDAASPVIQVVAHFAVYKLLGMAETVRTHDPGKRTDRTVQPGAEGRSSIWFLREAIRLRDREETRLHKMERSLPVTRTGQRARRYVP